MIDLFNFSILEGDVLPIGVYLRSLLELFFLFIIVYSLLYSLRGTRGANMLLGLGLVLVVFTLTVQALNLEVLSWVMNRIWLVVPTLLIVIFQPELRRGFAHIGSNPFSYGFKKREIIAEVISAVEDMARQRIGALIVFEGKIGMQSLVNDSIKLDVKLNNLLIKSIFFPNSPLHDGAVIIRGNRIVAARVILPLSRDENLSRTMGTRHRAALGVTEENDCVVVIVSEETGSISIAYQGGIRTHSSSP